MVKLFSYVAKTIVFLLFVGWIMSKLIVGEGSLFDAGLQKRSGTAPVAEDEGSDLIVPSSDPRFPN